ncbi:MULTISPECIES: histidine kinase [unclassified Streptomyces]|uniref:sensor histidine kinase n=1 Tax=unclassified Streptomyces TaxID=2593676 RepID=UPI002DD8C412|nr:histidine kinase [Streptomyces sp. NBC_01795]WSA95005.1 histidine kinase [Streptomyces sp. NBC_01795]WSS41083.1 histidine kinase [Streptomyces sp. NBC_01187]
MERRRIARCYDVELGSVPGRAGRVMVYLALRTGPGLLGAAVLVAVTLGVLSASFLVWGWFVLARLDNPGDVLLSACGGLFLLFLAVQGVYGVALWETALTRRFLGPDGREVLERRIGELAATRAGVVEAVHEERRRIERDLHDGVQQRLVALALVLGRARRATAQPDKSAALLRQAHEESQLVLAELREVAWRVYPAMLDEGGLRAALETVAERAVAGGVPVTLAVELPVEPPPTVRAVAYFVAAEAVTNAVKHAGATHVEVEVAVTGDGAAAVVSDGDSMAAQTEPRAGAGASAAAGSHAVTAAHAGAGTLPGAGTTHPVAEARSGAGHHPGAGVRTSPGPRPDPGRPEPGPRSEAVSAASAAATAGLTVSVRDDGCGGADATGSGLLGLARRVAALDGRFTVASPAGGPTVITAELPCA